MGDQNKPLIFFYISNLYAEKDSHQRSKRLQVVTICKISFYIIICHLHVILLILYTNN